MWAGQMETPLPVQCVITQIGRSSLDDVIHTYTHFLPSSMLYHRIEDELQCRVESEEAAYEASFWSECGVAPRK